jgi:DNA (cytosine-5)-methyltransferase 1
MTALLSTGRGRDGAIRARDGFSGAGGSAQALRKVPGLQVGEAINHDRDAIYVHAVNFPEAEHVQTNIQTTCVSRRKPAAFSWDSPACPHWTDAAGRPMWFDKSNQYAIPGLEPQISDTAVRSRALMTEVPLYLEAMWLTGFPVLAGVVENVPQVRKWAEWDPYLNRFHMLGYKTKLIALNSAHVTPVRTKRAPQSRNRAYLAYWLEILGRDPDWDKWLRPTAWCPRCDRKVQAMQVFKDPRKDMGVYGVTNGQYVYRCPDVRCRGQIVEPDVIGAETAIDFDKPITAIGDRARPLEPMTMARIGAGVVKYAKPFLTPAGGTWRDAPTALTEPMPTRTTRESDGLVALPMLIPTEGRPGKTADSVTEPGRAQTCRRETGVAIPPLVITLRGGGSVRGARTPASPMPTLTANGNHVGLAEQPALDLLIPYHGNGSAAPIEQPMGTLTTRDRYGRVRTETGLDVDPQAVAGAVAEIETANERMRALKKEDENRAKKRNGPAIEALKVDSARVAAEMGLDPVLFRMLENDEIHRGMAFDDDFIMPTDVSKRTATRLYGNAVTPPAAEVIASALMEIILGVEFEREPVSS